jgi:hypothetical protein
MRGTALLIAAFALAAFGMASGVRALADGAAKSRPGVVSPEPPVPSPTRKLDEYGNISWEDERARLDNFTIELMNNPNARGYMTCYGGRVGRVGEARRRCERAKNYVSGYRGVEASRVVTVDGGYKEDLTVELWVVPQGVKPPQATPTVDPSEVRFIKGKSKRKPRGRRAAFHRTSDFSPSVRS